MDEQETQQQEVVEQPEQETPGSEDNAAAAAPEIKVGKEEEVVPLRERIAKRVEQVQKKPAAEKTTPETPAKPIEEKAAAPKPGEVPPVGEKPAAEAFKADFKFRFTDEKGQKQETEFPEFLRGAVTTKEQEEELRTLCA